VFRLLGVVALCSALFAAAPATAAAPSYILVSGSCLPQPAALSSWSENATLLSSLVRARHVSAASERLRRRPRLDLALFWGLPSKRSPTRPADAAQHGWFYPAFGKRRPVLDLMVDGVRAPRQASARALAILGRHGVPTRLPLRGCSLR
jgi:hypothetical protein